MNLVLASQSEWRRKLLEQLGIPFEVVVSGLDESSYSCDDPEELVAMLATAKAREVAKRLNGGLLPSHQLQDLHEGITLVIGADTVIVVGDRIIGKPVDRQEAAEIITLLQDNRHQVMTGLTVVEPETGEQRVETVVTQVDFGPMSSEQRENFLDSGEWEGKAGAYQIQRSIAPFVVDMKGSVTGLIGLPLVELVGMLEEFGWAVESDPEELELLVRRSVFQQQELDDFENQD